MRKVWMTIAVGVALLGAMPGTAAAKKQRFAAKVGGKALRIPSKTAAASTNGLGGIVITGAKVTLHGHSASSRTLTIGCYVPGLAAGMTLPVTVTCTGTYFLQVGLSGKAWGSDNGISLTVTAFNGTRLVGTFSGELPPGDTNASDPPVSVQKGKVSVDLQGG